MLINLLLIFATIIGNSPATNPRARLLTVEEAVGQSKASLDPERLKLYWTGDSELTKESPEPSPKFLLPISDLPAISYGQSVSRNEFGIKDGVFPAPNGKLLAIYRKDESAVGQFPLFDINKGLQPLYYPYAGSASEQLQLCICDTKANILCSLQIDDFSDERYLTGVSWSPDSKYVFVQVLDRSQHNMLLNMYRASDGRFVRTILSEFNDAWIEPGEPLYFIKNSYQFIYTSDNRDSYRNLYLCDTLGRVNRLVNTDADLQYIANDGEYVYYSSAEVSPIENHLFRIKLGGIKPLNKLFNKPQRLTFEDGWHEIDMAPDCSKFIDRYSNLNTPGITLIRDSDGSIIEKVLTALDPLDEFAKCEVELGSIPSADNQFDNYYRLYYPRGYDPSKKYPLIVYVYGGPHSQMVRNSWLANIRKWEMLMAQKGYFVYVQDNRGTSRQGAAYEKAINRHCGQLETADQLAGIDALLERVPQIDRNRVGVHGWSYGGFMSLNLATARPGFFKVTVAGGPVIDWRWYEVMYGERYMDSPRTNAIGYEQTSLLNKVDSLSGRVLICQGAIDDTVLWQHALSFIDKCIEKEKSIDFFCYPTQRHNMIGRSRVHLYEKITDYFETYL